MKTKILSLFFASLLIILTVSVTAFATLDYSDESETESPGWENEESETVVTIGDVTVSKGQSTVDVPITVSGNTGLAGLQLSMTYSDGLELTAIERGDALSGLTYTKPNDLTANPITLVLAGEVADDTNGTLYTLTFSLPNDTAQTYSVDVEVIDAYDNDMETVAVTVDSGIINVESVISAVGKSLLLDGGIGVKVYFEYDPDVVSIDGVTAEATVINSDNGLSDTVELELFEAENLENTVYGIIEVSPKDYENITMNVTASAVGSSSETVAFKVSEIIDEYQLSNTVSSSVISLVNALEAYCEQADIFFNNKTAKEITLTAEEESALTMPTLTGNKTVGNLTFFSSTLLLKSKVTIRHYFTIDGEFDLSDYTVDGAEFYDRGDGYAYLEIADINASELHYVKNVILEKGDSKIVLSFSPLNYVTLNYKSTDTRLANIVKALYKYNIESKNYLNPEITYPLEEDEVPRVQW
ncbi:MAG: hypothetical protein IJ323_06020 [Clostridia bacterium]|nr:hypothetical protein [Clostridia bacterium]